MYEILVLDSQLSLVVSWLRLLMVESRLLHGPGLKFAVLQLVVPVFECAEKLFDLFPVWLLKLFLISSTIFRNV